MTDKVRREEMRVSGDDLMAKFKELWHEGDVRRIIIKNEDGRTLIEIPLNIGVVGAILLPVAAAVGAIAAIVTDCTIVVEKVDGAAKGSTEEPPSSGVTTESA